MGRFDDFLVSPDHLDDELDDWDQELFRYRGDPLRMVWLDDETSRHVRDVVFGLGRPE